MTPAPLTVDALVAEIGSTTTVVSAFTGLAGFPASEPRLLGQGFAPTSVADGDVGIGVAAARAQLEAVTGPLTPGVTLATSSAAGGLRMSVHGLTTRMTAMAAREAALGAGAVVKYQTAGRLRDSDLTRIALVDIETTGLTPGYDQITVIGLADGVAAKVFVAGRPLGNDEALDKFRETIKAYDLVVTFNGANFDVPFIEKHFRDSHFRFDQPHLDLLWPARSLGLNGGLKDMKNKLALLAQRTSKKCAAWKRFNCGAPGRVAIKRPIIA